MDMQFYSKQYLNGAKIPLKIDGTPAYELTEMKFASSCVNKCTRASVDILSGRISGKRHLTEQLNIIITNLRLATSILRLKDNDLDDFKAFEDQSVCGDGILFNPN